MTASWEIREGDCCALMAAMPEASVDAIVCDPPYGLEFMGRDWDRLDGARIRQPSQRDRTPGAAHNASTSLVARNVPDAYVAGPRMQAWHERWAREALRVLKPGGFLLAAGGTRTYHRLVCAVEDAGFEIRDRVLSLGNELGSELDWLYGSGFPKSLDVSKAIDKAAGAEREVVGSKLGQPGYSLADGPSDGVAMSGNVDGSLRKPEAECAVTAPATPEAERWEGWGTALKPAHEPIVVARKPLAGTVAGNVLAHGTGALNIDGCRVGTTKRVPGGISQEKPNARVYGRYGIETGDEDGHNPNVGRWPANVVLSHSEGCVLVGERQECVPGCAVRTLDEQSGVSSDKPRVMQRNGKRQMDGWRFRATTQSIRRGDAGSASRFFYTAKASTAERGPDNKHPTVKPVDLMCWLVRLVTPPGGLVLDPFVGSGTTGIAALREGFSFIGLEREPEYVTLARRRIIDDAPLLNVAAEVAA